MITFTRKKENKLCQLGDIDVMCAFKHLNGGVCIRLDDREGDMVEYYNITGGYFGSMPVDREVIELKTEMIIDG